MCGIAGQYNFVSGAPADIPILRTMAARMAQRGPDGEGLFTDGSLGFIHRRLAIIDLEGGHQPMSTADGKYWICYNGETYNAPELLDELRSLGHEPRTRSDVEAVLLAYRQWGQNFVEHLNGMFAIALWDREARRLVLCRDRLGIKPLYYVNSADGITWASEAKALRCVPGVDITLDLDAVDDYMTLGYVVNPRSIVRGIRKLSPGTMLVIDPDKAPQIQRYWNLAFTPDHSEKKWTEQIRDLLRDSVRLQLRSDVPLGLFISGGVDSTALAANLTEIRGSADGVHSFCVGVENAGEFSWAKLAARHVGTTHHELVLSAHEHGEMLREAAMMLGEPVAEPMIGQLLALCRLARQHVTVALSGEGADEIFFGYTRYRVMAALEYARRMMPAFMIAQAHRMPALHSLAEPLERRYLGVNQFDTKRSLYSHSMHQAVRNKDPRESLRQVYDDAGGSEVISRMAGVDCRAWLVDNTLMRTDVISMSASLEVRVPFLDHRLVELAARIPSRLKVKPWSQKDILKKALRGHVPNAVLNRRKMGFPTPLADLFRGPWGKTAQEILLSPCKITRTLFDTSIIEKRIHEHRTHQRDWSRVLFQVLMLEFWGHGVE